MRVLGLIPARGGSKGIPRKNARLLAGKPLVLYTVEAALAASRLARVVVTTDDAEIATIARSGRAETPFMRPAQLARDDTPMLPVIRHAIAELQSRGDTFDAICLLQPTNPLRPASLIDECVDVLEARACSAVVTVLPVPSAHNPHWVYMSAADGTLRLFSGAREPVTRRQDLPSAYHREGSVYVTRTAVLREGSLYGASLVGVRVDPALSVNIDDAADWERAERMLETVRV